MPTPKLIDLKYETGSGKFSNTIHAIDLYCKKIKGKLYYFGVGLTYVSGVGPKLAESIVQHRDENGPFASRANVKKVSGLGAKTFEQCAGFLRIRNAKNPLDASAVHPESYSIVRSIANDLDCSVADLISNSALREKIKLENYVTDTVGLPTLSKCIRR